jgi:hypothetical protein
MITRTWGQDVKPREQGAFYDRLKDGIFKKTRLKDGIFKKTRLKDGIFKKTRLKGLEGAEKMLRERRARQGARSI